MNKTVTINISGIIFHIEEDAYEKLGNYLKTVRNRFSAEDGRDEIMMDIESRVAEILQTKTGPSKQVVVMADVDYVIALMGEPEAISDNEEKTEEKSSKEESTRSHGSSYTRRRLYRDVDDKLIGGVCSGLGYYFDLDPVWIRVGFAVAFFVFGTGFLFYILLLLIIPKAETTAEKLEMRGEPVDVNNISRTIKEEFDGFKKKAENFGEDLKSRGKKWKDESKEYWRSNRRRSHVDDFFHNVFRIIGKIFAFFLIVVGIFFLIGLLTSTFALGSFQSDVFGDNLANLFPDNFQYTMAVTAFLLVFGIPTLMMIYSGIRIAFRITARHRAVSITALSLWLLGIIMGAFSIVQISKAFSEDGRVHETFNVQNPHRNKLFLNVNIDRDMANDDYNSKFNHRHHLINRWKSVYVDGKLIKFGFPTLKIVPSNNDSIQLIVYKYASGASKRDAQDRAKAIEYHISQMDSLITFSSYFTMGESQHWREQSVEMELLIPTGTEIFLGRSMLGLLNDVDNLSNTLDEDMVDRRWIMTARGLQCLDCAGLEVMENQSANSLPQQKDSLSKMKNADTIIIHHH